jgi:hypothetical protein
LLNSLASPTFVAPLKAKGAYAKRAGAGAPCCHLFLSVQRYKININFND